MGTGPQVLGNHKALPICDIHRQKRLPGASTSVDAAQCYDRMNCIWRLATTLWGGMRIPFQGTCQGNGAGLAIWLGVVSGILQHLETEGHGLDFTSAITEAATQKMLSAMLTTPH
eukprot:scaffold20541_cov58-Attheya_sp.AAC.2